MGGYRLIEGGEMSLIPIQFVEVTAGTDIKEAIMQSIYYAKRHNCIVKFNFNGVNMEVSSLSDVDEQIDYYHKEASDEKA